MGFGVQGYGLVGLGFGEFGVSKARALLGLKLSSLKRREKSSNKQVTHFGFKGLLKENRNPPTPSS